jgi:hypothetical protein
MSSNRSTAPTTFLRRTLSKKKKKVTKRVPTRTILVSPEGPIFDNRGVSSEDLKKLIVVNLRTGIQHEFNVNRSDGNTHFRYPTKKNTKRYIREGSNVHFVVSITENGKYHGNIKDLYYPEGRLQNDPRAYAVVGSVKALTNTAEVNDHSFHESGFLIQLPPRNVYSGFQPPRNSLSPKVRRWSR